MAESTTWWLLAGALIAAELVSGTFYLLMMAFGFAAAALSAHAGAPVSAQLSVAALISVALVVAWRSYKRSSAAPAAGETLNMDIGAFVDVQHWDESGNCQVKYRGANWQASLHAGESPALGQHQIVEVRGSRLILKRI